MLVSLWEKLRDRGKQSAKETDITEKRKHSLSLNSASTTTCSLSSSSDSSTDPINRKELFNKYKTKMQEVREGGSSTSKSKSLTKAKNVVGIHLGGMVYNHDLQKGMKKKNISSPRVIDFSRSSQYSDIIAKGISVFFPSESDSVRNYCLAGPNGIPFEIEDEEEWYLGQFLKDHNFQPSKLRLYILHMVSEDDDLSHGSQSSRDIKADDEDQPASKTPRKPTMPPPLAPPLKQSCIRYTKPQVQRCISCGAEFLAPIEDTMCELPDGGVVAYCDPVLKCPNCDENQFGYYWNKEFMGLP